MLFGQGGVESRYRNEETKGVRDIVVGDAAERKYGGRGITEGDEG